LRSFFREFTYLAVVNIKKSLALQFSLLVAAILFIFSLFVYHNFSLFRHNEFYERLKEKGFTISELLIEESEIDTSFLHAIERNNLNVLHQQRIFVYDSLNNLVYRGSNEFAQPEEVYLTRILKENEIEFTEGDVEYAGFSLQHLNGKYLVVIGGVDETGIKNLEFLRSLLITIFILSLVASGFLGWLFAKRSLSPMVEVIDEVDQITAKNLHMRVKVGDNKDEIAHLAVTFNQMLNRLEGSFIMQKNFVSNASHEFRTPLTSMKGEIEVTLMQKRDEDRYIKTLTSINEDINHLIELLQGLSELAKVNADLTDNELEPVAIVDLLLDTRADLLKNKPNYRIELDIQHFTGEGSNSITIGNAALLKSAFTNLMDNACKFSPKQQVKVIVDLKEHPVICFIDEGIGISNEDMEHIFEPFFRGNDTRNISGHGIGLSLVKRIVELHNGTITVNSVQGEGTTFTVELPAMEN
jgi:signal transduction histidine kinase